MKKFELSGELSSKFFWFTTELVLAGGWVDK
jgi:hypothetical protein